MKVTAEKNVTEMGYSIVPFIFMSDCQCRQLGLQMMCGKYTWMSYLGKATWHLCDQA